MGPGISKIRNFQKWNYVRLLVKVAFNLIPYLGITSFFFILNRYNFSSRSPYIFGIY